MTPRAPCRCPSLILASACCIVVSFAPGLVVSGRAYGADDPVDAATKLYEMHRYDQAARLLEQGLARLDAGRRAQAHLVLGIVYLRNADLHEALTRTATTAELDYFGKLLKTGREGRSRYARLYLAELLLAGGNALEAKGHFERIRVDPGVESRYRAIAGVGLGS
ncbi:MAG: hypothetical protein WBO23_15250, partial [Burkholderiales bacterium]